MGYLNQNRTMDELKEKIGYEVIDILTNGNYINGITACEIAEKLKPKLSALFQSEMAKKGVTIKYYKKEQRRLHKDELYGVWYHCPECNYNSIIEGARFCINCGVPIVWDTETLTSKEEK